MSVYADKKNGQLTGLWRVDIKKGTERYRQRYANHAEPVTDAKRVQALWRTGEAVAPRAGAPTAPTAPTLQTLRDAADGTLWEGSSQELANWVQVDVIIDFLGETMRLDSIDTLTIDSIIKHLKVTGRKGERSDATVNRHLSHFRKFLTWGRERKLVPTPISDIKFEWRKESAGRVRWITAAEDVALQKHLPPKTWKLVKVAIETGCRREELWACEAHQITVGEEEDMLHLWKTKKTQPDRSL